MNLDLSGKVAAVTGASKGIGLESRTRWREKGCASPRALATYPKN